jgi:hypothetical protein
MRRLTGDRVETIFLAKVAEALDALIRMRPSNRTHETLHVYVYLSVSMGVAFALLDCRCVFVSLWYCILRLVVLIRLPIKLRKAFPPIG